MHTKEKSGNDLDIIITYLLTHKKTEQRTREKLTKYKKYIKIIFE
jgi:hypothetical protein